ncbi:phage tail protein [Pseudomonas nitroreducens]|uniref:phage tail protein n=1 Tax=Pseudomonas nitroreducens TaxID=46680 RepID=UPI00030BA167|nr:phage tail protein [Pseudomonas nitroreducens]
MAYLDLLQSGMTHIACASEAGRRSLDGMLSPVNGAISDIAGAVGELDVLPGVPDGVSEQLRRIMGGISAAQQRANDVASIYNRTSRVLSGIDERLGQLGEQTGRAAAAVNRVAGSLSPALSGILPTTAFAPDLTPAPEAVKPFSHLLILQPLAANSAPFYFNLDTAAFDQLTRQTEFRWASQERLTRRPAQQSPGLGEERISLKGAIFPNWRGGLAQLDTLRTIGAQLQPLNLTTGYGQVLGLWCLARLEEEQGALLRGGIPRKQTFTLEFIRYGEDLPNV